MAEPKFRQDYRKEMARIRAERLRLLILEAFGTAREGRILYNSEHLNDLWDTLEALAPMLREMKDEFEKESDYIAVNFVLGRIMAGRENGHLFDRRMKMFLSMVLTFEGLFETGRKFLELRSVPVLEADA